MRNSCRAILLSMPFALLPCSSVRADSAGESRLMSLMGQQQVKETEQQAADARLAALRQKQADGEAAYQAELKRREQAAAEAARQREEQQQRAEAERQQEQDNKTWYSIGEALGKAMSGRRR